MDLVIALSIASLYLLLPLERLVIYMV
jgi:hypothetical protein